MDSTGAIAVPLFVPSRADESHVKSIGRIKNGCCEIKSNLRLLGCAGVTFAFF